MGIRWIALLVLMGCHAALAQEAAAPKPADDLDEVEIIAAREKLYEIRAAIVEAEDRFYEKYNELNEDDQFDIHCNMEKRTGTNLSARVCRPVFVNRATEEEALAFLTGRSAPPASMAILAKSADYEKNVLALINRHPELRKAVKEREDLGKRYEAVRKQKFKGRLVVFE